MEQDLDRLTKVANRFELIGRNPQLAPLDLQSVVRDLEEYCRVRLPRRGRAIRLATQFEPVPKVDANRTLLEWALEAVAKNGIDALAGRGGTLQISADRTADDEVRIRVADDGPGIPRELRARVFEPGFSTKESGWGIGLSLARRIIEEAHGGRLELAPSSEGATFDVILHG